MQELRNEVRESKSFGRQSPPYLLVSRASKSHHKIGISSDRVSINDDELGSFIAPARSSGYPTSSRCSARDIR